MDRTRETLLIKIRDAADSEAWEEFHALYKPLIYSYAASKGLQSADAEDVTQDSLKAVASAIRNFEYDPAKGTFRSWIYQVVRSKLANYFSKEARQHAKGTGRTTVIRMVEETPSDSDVADWELEYKKHMFEWASQRVRGEFANNTWSAFWQAAVEEKEVKSIASGLGMTVGAVYIAKSRVIARLRDVIQTVSGEVELLPDA